MSRRGDPGPRFDAATATSADEVAAHQREWRADTLDTIEALGALRQRAQEASRQLENPTAVSEYIDFFADLFARAAADLERVAADLARNGPPGDLDALRQIASNAAVEQRRCLVFRDKWINRPLPFEQVRPLLNEISTTTRDQLADYRDLTEAAVRLRALAPPAPPDAGHRIESRSRRELFTRWFGR
jgi:hypothetical protein